MTPLMDIYDSNVCLLKESQTIMSKDIINLHMPSDRSNPIILQNLAVIFKH